MKAAVYDRPRELEIRDVLAPEPGPGEVRLRVLRTGVCGTDVHLHDGEFFPVYPLIPGHEIVGEIDAIGPESAGGASVRIGQRVALDNMLVCGLCDNCRRARPQYCRRLQALGVTDAGGFAEYVVAPAEKCFVVDDLDLDTAVLVEPTACAIHGMDILQPRAQSDVLIFGAGPTGLILAQLLRAGGAGRLTVAAPTRFKLDIAARHGADETVLMSRTDAAQTRSELERIAPDGFDIVIDATGNLGVLREAATHVRDGGTLFIYGMAAEDAELGISPYDIFRRELTIKGSFSQAYSFDRAVQALRTGRVSSEGLITHRFDLAHYADALEAVRSDRECLKAVIDF